VSRYSSVGKLNGYCLNIWDLIPGRSRIFLIATTSTLTLKPRQSLVRKNVEIGICPICRKEEELSHILRCDGMKMWREEILDKRFWNIDPEIGIRKIAGCTKRDVAEIRTIFK
jgi:hypothetical protein